MDALHGETRVDLAIAAAAGRGEPAPAFSTARAARPVFGIEGVLQPGQEDQRHG
ncbi:hypothetical protein [uncultured Methylobacterium sp.]|uniref:hypothetical protein n=1 Tax=uncultured Methylobacterium sp. TaxID=157278 RepID=UPI0035CA1E85